MKNSDKLPRSNSTDTDASNDPEVIILLTTHKDPPLFNDILESLKKTKYSNLEVLVLDCHSTKVEDVLKSSELRVPVRYFVLHRDRGAAHHLNTGMRLALQGDAKYIVRIEGDAVPLGSKWLRELVSAMESQSDVAIAFPIDVNKEGNVLGYGNRLYGNCNASLIAYRPSEVYPCLGRGGHCFITRRTYLEELFGEGVNPYWNPFYVSSEDQDFNLKAWLRSYKVVIVSSVKVLHEGTTLTSSVRASYRVYHMYKNRLCLLLLNFGFKHIMVNIWYRLLHDIASAFIHSEPILTLKGYLWVITNLRKILQQRRLRMARWKRVNDKSLKRHVLVKLPMPIRMNKL